MTVSPFLKDFGHELSFCLLIFVLGCCDCWLNWPEWRASDLTGARSPGRNYIDKSGVAMQGRPWVAHYNRVVANGDLDALTELSDPQKLEALRSRLEQKPRDTAARERLNQLLGIQDTVPTALAQRPAIVKDEDLFIKLIWDEGKGVKELMEESELAKRLMDTGRRKSLAHVVATSFESEDYDKLNILIAWLKACLRTTSPDVLDQRGFEAQRTIFGPRMIAIQDLQTNILDCLADAILENGHKLNMSVESAFQRKDKTIPDEVSGLTDLPESANIKAKELVRAALHEKIYEDTIKYSQAYIIPNEKAYFNRLQTFYLMTNTRIQTQRFPQPKDAQVGQICYDQETKQLGRKSGDWQETFHGPVFTIHQDAPGDKAGFSLDLDPDNGYRFQIEGDQDGFLSIFEGNSSKLGTLEFDEPEETEPNSRHG